MKCGWQNIVTFLFSNGYTDQIARTESGGRETESFFEETDPTLASLNKVQGWQTFLQTRRLIALDGGSDEERRLRHVGHAQASGNSFEELALALWT